MKKRGMTMKQEMEQKEVTVIGINNNQDKVKVNYFENTNNYYMDQNYNNLKTGDIALVKEDKLYYIDSVYYQELHQLNSTLLKYDNAKYKEINNKLSSILFKLTQRLNKEFKLFQK